MAKDTKIIVTVPGDFNEDLARYMFYLQDVGVKTTKANVIIQLARIGYRCEVMDIKQEREEGHDTAG